MFYPSFAGSWRERFKVRAIVADGRDRPAVCARGTMMMMLMMIATHVAMMMMIVVCEE